MCENIMPGVWHSRKDSGAMYKLMAAKRVSVLKFISLEYLVLCLVEHSVAKQDFYQWQQLLTVADQKMGMNHTGDTIYY
jgi:hypothetical protein